MALTYRSAGAWGAGKGANLTPAEVDANFYQLTQDIAAAAAAAGTPVGISNITVSGTQMLVYLSDATVLGPYTLPRLPFRPAVTDTVSDATHAPTGADVNGYKICTNASGCVVTVPSDDEADIPTDTEITYCQDLGAGPVSFEGSTAVDLRWRVGFDPVTAGELSVVTLKKVAADTWHLIGALAEEST